MSFSLRICPTLSNFLLFDQPPRASVEPSAEQLPMAGPLDPLLGAVFVKDQHISQYVQHRTINS